MPPKTGKGRKAKGNNFERAVIKVLEAAGLPCSRNALTGQQFDKGDILGIPNWTLECKAYTNVTEGIKKGVDDMLVERINNNTRWGVAIIKRPRASIEDAYCVMPLRDMIVLIKAMVGMERLINKWVNNNNTKQQQGE